MPKELYQTFLNTAGRQTMSERKRVFFLIATMITTCLIIAGVAITILYRTAINENRERLIETAQSQARLIESTARFNAVYSKNYPGGPNSATLSQIIDAYDHDTVIGKTEIVLSKKEGENIVFLLRHRHKDHSKPEPISFESKLAEPMRRSLSGQSGSVIGLDYHGQTVLAAYESLKELNLGIVAKIDMSDVRAPFVKAGLIVVFCTVLVVLIGAGFFLQLTNPMIRLLEERTLELQKLNNEMEQRVERRTSEIKKVNEQLRVEIKERERAERTVRESEERYSLAVAGSTDGIWDWDILSDTVFYSERFREFLGYFSEEFPETLDTFRSCLHPVDADAVWAAVERHLQERVPYNIKYRLQTKWGEYRWFLARGQAIWDSKGNATRMSGSIQDITKLKQAEESLRKSEEKYRLLIKTIPAVVYKGYPDWRVEFVDKKIEALTGHAPDTFNSGRSKWSDIIVEEDLEAVNESFIQALKTEKIYTREYRIREISGEIKWIQDRGYIVCDNQGEVEFISGIFFDITDRKIQEEEFRKTKKLLQSVFDGIPDPLVLMDERLKVRIINHAAMRYYQIEKPEDIDGLCCYEALLGKSAPCEGCQVPAAVASRKSGSFERIGVMNPNNLEQVNIYHFDEKGHTFGGALMRIHDITESRLMERKMIHNEKLASLGLTISCITHEIANPIGAITFNAPILKDYINAMIPIVDDHAKDLQDFELFQMPYPQFREDAFKITANILHASQRIHTTLSNLRKLYGNKKQQHKRWVDLKQLVKKVSALTGVEIGEHVKFFEINIPENLSKIYTDPDAVEQILTNLLINAAHAADKKDSQIKLDVTRGDTWKDRFIIELSDNGCGMDQKTLSEIFNPFFTTKASGQGTGLGLYVCQDLVKDLGGRIEVQSEPGNGSVFRVILPDIERRAARRL
jgi:PAS domain S-box-containing protein